jgi:hypothetical protein
MIEQNVENIERFLKSRLQPVKPNPDYIGRLQKQLRSAQNVILENQPQTKLLGFILAGIIASALVLFLIKPSKKK